MYNREGNNQLTFIGLNFHSHHCSFEERKTSTAIWHKGNYQAYDTNQTSRTAKSSNQDYLCIIYQIRVSNNNNINGSINSYFLIVTKYKMNLLLEFLEIIQCKVRPYSLSIRLNDIFKGCKITLYLYYLKF